jgi:hypothetical protein
MAIRIGITISDYNEMTPYELRIHIESITEKLQSEQDERISIAWLTAYLHRVDKFPALQDLLNKTEKKDMTDEEMLETVKILNAAFSGTVQTKEGE